MCPETGQKTSFLRHFILKPNICQDRLGTNIGKIQRVLLSQTKVARSPSSSASSWSLRGSSPSNKVQQHQQLVASRCLGVCLARCRGIGAAAPGHQQQRCRPAATTSTTARATSTGGPNVFIEKWIPTVPRDLYSCNLYTRYREYMINAASKLIRSARGDRRPQCARRGARGRASAGAASRWPLQLSAAQQVLLWPHCDGRRHLQPHGG